MTRSAESPSIHTVRDAMIPESFAACERITRTRARNFYYGLKLTPEPKRSAMYAIYAWMRAADDLADAPGISPKIAVPSAGESEERRRRIETFRRRTRAALKGQPFDRIEDEHLEIWPAICGTFSQYRFSPDCFDAMIDGQLLDQEKKTYADFTELRDYCYKVASTVGLVCLQIWGFEGGDATRKMAEDRGLALQLTNILRDLVEDARRDRVYLPADELAQFGYASPEDFRAAMLAARADERFDRLMQFQVDRARGYYESSAALDARLDAACCPTSWALMYIYRRLLDKIAANPRQVLTRRVRLSSFQKALIALRAT